MILTYISDQIRSDSRRLNFSIDLFLKHQQFKAIVYFFAPTSLHFLYFDLYLE